jgi:hypothetical protein
MQKMKKKGKKAGARELNTAEWEFALFALAIKKKVTDARCNFDFAVLQFCVTSSIILQISTLPWMWKAPDPRSRVRHLYLTTKKVTNQDLQLLPSRPMRMSARTAELSTGAQRSKAHQRHPRVPAMPAPAPPTPLAQHSADPDPMSRKRSQMADAYM